MSYEELDRVGVALATVRRQYEGFGPTLAHEKLTELHGLRLSLEGLRHWMTRDGLWVPRAAETRGESGATLLR